MGLIQRTIITVELNILEQKESRDGKEGNSDHGKGSYKKNVVLAVHKHSRFITLLQH